MSCLGGTWDEPREWFRFVDGQPDREVGRVEGCPVEGRDTRRKLCYGCPAFRGRDRTGAMVGPLAANGDIIALSAREHERYLHWIEEEGDPTPFYDWLDGIEDVYGEQRRAEWRQSYMREYQREYMRARRADPERREAEREATRERMRRLRAARKEASLVR